MKTFEQAVEFMNEYLLNKKELTYGSNGYPQFKGETRLAYYGFEDFASAESLASQVGGTIEKIHHRDGCTLADSICDAYEALCISSDNYGDNYQEWGCPKEELNTLKERISEMDNIEDIECAVETYRTCLNEYTDCDDQYFVLTNCGAYYDTIPRRPMCWSHDSHNYHIAVVINSSKYQG